MKKLNDFLDILVRYLILVLVAFPNLYLFYLIFSPLTIYSVYFILKLFTDVSLTANLIQVNGYFPIEIIKACVAGSAYYLLLILNLSTPKIKFSKRIKMILISFLAFLVLNISIILLMFFLFLKQSPFFDFIHLFFWYVVSVVFVVGIWFLEVKLFKIKKIPVYSDFKFLLKKARK